MGAKVGVGTNEKQSAFWIAAGLFSDADFAQARAEALAQNPKLAQRISVQYDGRMYRVLVAGGDNATEADGILTSVKQTASDAIVQKIAGPSSRSRKLEIYFDFNQAVIRPGEAERIQAFLAELNGAQGTFDLIGHCDSRGSNGYNLQLGLRRAKSTAAYLSQLAGPVSSTETSRSEWDLQSPCPDGVPCNESAHERNRRVVLVFEPK
jgi:outer membrane protein OmpA-like peptidoglycan-associated protein